MRKGQLVLAVVLSVILLAACAPQAAPAPSSPQSPPAAPRPASAAPAAPAAPTRPAWQVEWEKVLAEAKKEGSVAVATSGAPFRSPFQQAMGQYGVKAEIMTGRFAELNPKILAERRAGLYLWDVQVGGITSYYTDLEPAGALTRLDPFLVFPDVTDPELIKKVWFQGKLWWADSDHFVMSTLMYPYLPFAVNNSLVKSGEIKSYNDLLDPKWKGKMSINDPTLPGSTFPSYVLRIFGQDWMRKLAKQEPIIMRDQRLQGEWLSHGKAAIALGIQDVVYIELKNAGAPIQSVVPAEGTWLSAGQSPIHVFDRPSHPNATKLFVNWILSKEGQTVLSKISGGQSAREDVPTDFLTPDQIRQPGVKYWEKETKEVSFQKAEDMKLCKDIFGPLIK